MKKWTLQPKVYLVLEVFIMGTIVKIFKAIGAGIVAIIVVALGTAILLFGAPIMSVLLLIGGCTLGAILVGASIYQHLTRPKIKKA